MGGLFSKIEGRPTSDAVGVPPDASIPYGSVRAALKYILDTLASGVAPTNAEYLVATADTTLTGERVTTDTTSIKWDHTTPAQAKAERAALTGDVTASQNSNATTLATVNGNVGSFGLAGSVAQFTVNAKGLITAAVDVAIQIAISAVTGLQAALDALAPQTRTLTAGNGLTGGGDLSANRTFDVGGSTSIIAGADDLQRAALTGDVTASQNSNSTTIADNAVTDGKLRDSAAVSVIGRRENSSGDPADIAAGANDTILQRVSNALSFGALTIGMFGANLVTFAKIAQGSALSVLGVTGNATADHASIAAASDHQVLRRSGTSLAFGAVNLAQANAAVAAFTAWTPTITSVGGTITSYTVNAATYVQIGKIVFFQIDIKINTVGTATGAMQWTHPVTAAAGLPSFCGIEAFVTGKSLVAFGNSTTIGRALFYDGTTALATNARFIVSGFYEAA